MVAKPTTTCLNCGCEPPPGSPLGLCSRCLSARLLDVGGEDDPDAEKLAAAFAKYDVAGEVARGGMGSILRAQDRTLGRAVAMKVMLLRKEASEEARQRFTREALVLARLDHPNIVPIHEMGQDGEGRPFYTMKLVQGETLQAILNRLGSGEAAAGREYTLDRLLTIFCKVCDGIAFAHSRGIIHRDLKPDNIMVGRFGEVLIMDWGLAKLVEPGEASARLEFTDESTRIIRKGAPKHLRGWSDPEFRQASAGVTMAGEVMGTPSFMSPEQARGLVKELDQRSDVFSLGAMLYVILTLRPPVEGGDVDEILRNVATANITPPARLTAASLQPRRATSATGRPARFAPALRLPHCPNGRVPSALSAVAMRALERNPGARYQSVTALAADIEAYQGGFATSVESVGAFGQLWLWMKRNQTVAASAALIAILSLGFMVKVIASERRAKANAEHATEQAGRARQAEASALEGRAETRKALAGSQIALAERAYLEGDLARLNQYLDSCPEDLRDSTWRYLDAKRHTSLASLKPAGEYFFRMLFRPAAGARPAEFVLGDARGNVCFASRGDLAVRRRLATGFATRPTLSLSADGRWLCASAAGDPTVRIFDASSGGLLDEIKVEKVSVAHAYLSPDAKSLLVEHTGGPGFFLLDIASRARRWGQSLGGHVSFDPHGRFVVHHHMTAEQDLWLLDPRDGSRIRRMEPGHNFVMNLSFSPDGSLLAAGDIFGYASIWDVETGRLKQRLKAGNGSAGDVAFTRDNRLVTLSTERADKGGQQRLRFWDILDGKQLDFRIGMVNTTGHIALDPDTGHVLCSGNPATLWQFPIRRFIREFTATKGGQSVGFLGDRYLFAPVTNRWLGLYDLEAAAGREVAWVGGVNDPWQLAVNARGTLACADSRLQKRLGALHRFTLADDGSFQRSNVPTSGFVERRIALDGTGQHVLISSLQGGIQVLPLGGSEPSLALSVRGVRQVRSVHFADGDRRILALAAAVNAAGDNEDWLLAWNRTTGTFLQGLTNRHAINALAVARDGSRLALGGAEKEIEIRDAADFSVLKRFRAHDDLITTLAFHPELPVLASASEDFSVKVWNYESGRLLDTFLGPTRRPGALAFSASGHLLACNSADNVTHVWKLDTLR
jgi:serine/threonine protein kinase/WD40 repeat protein